MSRFSVPEFGEKMRRLTCVSWRPDGREILASYSSDYIYIFDANSDSEERGKKLRVGNPVRKASRRRNRSPQPFKKLRLRGDWSDTGPHSRPETEARHGGGQQREERSAEAASSEREAGHQVSLMQRMTDALSRMLNDPSTRLAMQRLNSQAEGAELAAGGGTENREPRQEAGAELGARPRASQGQQSRAAVAIQDRWRRYRQRRHEAGDTPTLHQPSSSPDTMTRHSAPPSPGREQHGEGEKVSSGSRQSDASEEHSPLTPAHRRTGLARGSRAAGLGLKARPARKVSMATCRGSVANRCSAWSRNQATCAGNGSLSPCPRASES